VHCGRDVSELDALYTTLAKSATAQGVWGKMSNYHQAAIDALLGHGAEAERSLQQLNSTQRLGVGVTSFFRRHSFLHSWKSVPELCAALHGSFHIPFYCAFDWKACIEMVDGSPVIDGAYSMTGDGFPNTEETLVIAVNDGEFVDVACCPGLTNMQCLSPWEGERYTALRARGYESIRGWVRRRTANQVQIKSKRGTGKPNNAMLVLFWLLRMAEAILLRTFYRRILFAAAACLCFYRRVRK